MLDFDLSDLKRQEVRQSTIFAGKST